ncbi:unnamed protein product [Peniophora sp. CBMAI 1063]|nr:unnamed protein product [Peniophora sp. CBMAI 1063]
MTDSDQQMPLDFDNNRGLSSRSAPEERRYVVLRGYLPGVMDKLDAMLSTHRISGSLVIKYRTAAAAYRRWRRAIAAGNEIAQLGTAPVEERMAFTRTLRERLLRAARASAQASSPAPTQHRTDSISISGSLHTPPSSPVPGSPPSTPSPADLSRSPSPFPAGPSSSPAAINAISPFPAGPNNPIHSQGNSRVYQSQPHRPRFAPAGWVPPNEFTPPQSAGTSFVPRVPHPDVLSPGVSRSEWYVAYKHRYPGIYKSW